MASAANISLVGNLGQDPESRFTPNGSMNVSFSVAVNRRRGQDEITNWFQIAAWGKLGEVMTNLSQQGALVKGVAVYVAGRLTVREYTDRQDGARFSLDVDATDIQLLGRRGESGADDATPDDVPF